MIRDGVINALIGMSAALLTLLLTFEYLERPDIQKRIRRVFWGVDTTNRCQDTTGRHGTITDALGGGYLIVDWDDEPPTLIHMSRITPEKSSR